MTLPVEELDEETKKRLGLNNDKIPEKWVVHARVMLLLSNLEISEAAWVVNKIRHDLDRLKSLMKSISVKH